MVEEVQLVNPEITATLFDMLRAEGGVTETYRTRVLEFVQKRISDLEAHIEKELLPGNKDLWHNGPEVKVTEPNKEVRESLDYQIARDALSSAGLKFSAGIWYLVGKLGSRFSPVIVPEAEKLNIEEVIEFCYRIGVEGIAFHTRGEMGTTNRQAILKNLAARDMHVSSEFANLFSEIAMKFGGITSNYAVVRELSYLRKLESMLWCGQDKCKFQVDWLGQDGPLVYQPNSTRAKLLVQYMADTLMLTEMPLAIEYKTGDPAVKMTEKDVSATLSLARDAESLVYTRIKEQVMTEMRAVGKDDTKEWLTESVRRFSRFAGKIGINIEDGHNYTESARTTAHSVEESINAPLNADFLTDVATLRGHQIEVKEANDVIANYKGRLFHRHPNDAFIGQGDPDFVPGSVHEVDLVIASYHEQKAGLHKSITYEPDLCAVRGDPLKDFVESLNRVNRAHAIAANLIAIERREGLKCILDQSQEMFSRHYVEAAEMPLNYKRIDLAIVDKYREEIGKPVRFKYVPMQGHGDSLAYTRPADTAPKPN